jgi:sugar transferase EpsL
MAKRVVDIVVALVALVLLSPLLMVVAVLVRAVLGAPVLFRHRRPGLHGRLFTLYKFRTMLDACDAQGRPLPDQQRITRFGQILRKTSIDELPELWNVLRGDMSLVGPRPLLAEYLEHYTPEERRRHDVRPGITGWAQIHGRADLDWEEKLALDLWYVDHAGLTLDIKILWLTLIAVVTRRGTELTDTGRPPALRGLPQESLGTPT